MSKRYTIIRNGAKDRLIDTVTGAEIDSVVVNSPGYEDDLQLMGGECDAKNSWWDAIVSRSDAWREQHLTAIGKRHYAAWMRQA